MAEGRLSVGWVTTPEAFFELETGWDGLAAGSGTVFLTHFWLAGWVREFAPAPELRVLTLRDEGRLVAALPLVAEAHKGAPRVWRFMGAGSLTPNHLDVIAAPGLAEAARERFAAAIAEASDEWDVLDLDKLPEDTPTALALEQAFQRRHLTTSVELSAVCPLAVLPPSAEEYLQGLARKDRSNARRKMRRLMNEHPGASLDAVEDSKGLDRALDALVRQHQARWRSRGYAGAFGDPRSVRFHHDVAHAALERGCLRCYTLDIDGGVASVVYGFRTGDVVQQYQNSMAAEWERLGPGQVVLLHAIERSIEEGAGRYDLLEGDEPYKRSWCTTARRDVRLHVFNHNARGRLAQLRDSSRRTVVSAARRWVPAPVRETCVKGLGRYRVRGV